VSNSAGSNVRVPEDDLKKGNTETAGTKDFDSPSESLHSK
jgi:hypothetical protein